MHVAFIYAKSRMSSAGHNIIHHVYINSNISHLKIKAFNLTTNDIYDENSKHTSSQLVIITWNHVWGKCGTKALFYQQRQR